MRKEKPFLALVMILKNERHTIAKTIESIKPHIDYFTIVDTGSTDGTQAEVLRLLEGVKGSLHKAIFTNYATTKNLALSYLENTVNAKWVIFLSADEVVECESDLKSLLESQNAAVFNVKLATQFNTIYSPRIFRAGKGLGYEGEIHEELVNLNEPKYNFIASTLNGVLIKHSPTDPERRFKRLEEYDIPTLKLCIEKEEVNRTIKLQRFYFLLAQSLEFLAESPEKMEEKTSLKKQALENYKLAARMINSFQQNTTIQATIQMLAVNTAVNCLSNDEIQEALSMLNRHRPEDREVLLINAVYSAKNGLLGEAIQHILKLVNSNVEIYDRIVPNNNIILHQAKNLLTQCLTVIKQANLKKPSIAEMTNLSQETINYFNDIAENVWNAAS